jgi:hypothetical protein
MKKEIVQVVLVAWMIIVLATHWILRGGPGFNAAGAKVSFLRVAQEVISSWFYAPYGP